jgi:hypothetical protein
MMTPKCERMRSRKTRNKSGCAQALFFRTFLFGGAYPASLKRLGRLDLRPECVGTVSAAPFSPGTSFFCAACVSAIIDLSSMTFERFCLGFAGCHRVSSFGFTSDSTAQWLHHCTFLPYRDGQEVNGLRC